jgi:putative DNA primase/helicase
MTDNIDRSDELREWYAEDDCDTEPNVIHSAHLGMAVKLAEQFDGQLRYIEKIGWHRWDGTRWARGAASHARRAVHTVIKRDRIAVDQLTLTTKERTKLLAQIERFETASAITGILTEAAVLQTFWADVKNLDADPWLLNCANGTLDLHTLQLRDHNPADLITKVTAAAYRPDVTAVVWEEFLQRVLPDVEVRTYLQRILGLSLLGEVNGDKQIAPVLNGTGANGKTTAVEGVTFALGDYGHTAEPTLLMAKNGETHPTGTADLLGRRLVSTAETEQGRRFDIALLKRLTGGDTLKARFMRQDFFEFEPSHLLVMSTNHLPRIDDDTVAVWRRLRVIPFTVEIPESDWDDELKDKLRAQADAVLTWVIDGWRDYREHGMATPAAVLAATGEYKAESDAVGRFIEDECFTGGAQAAVRTQALYARWEKWAAKDGCLPLSRIAFGRALDTKGFPAEKTHDRLRRRICLRDEGAGE